MLEQRTEWVAALEPALYVALARMRELLVFERAGELLGLCVFDLSSAFIHASYVHPSAVRAGVGRQLMATAERALLAHGASEARLHATLNAVPFYKRSATCARAMPAIACRAGWSCLAW
jgi:putative acetyltransferase